MKKAAMLPTPRYGKRGGSRMLRGATPITMLLLGSNSVMSAAAIQHGQKQQHQGGGDQKEGAYAGRDDSLSPHLQLAEHVTGALVTEDERTFISNLVGDESFEDLLSRDMQAYRARNLVENEETSDSSEDEATDLLNTAIVLLRIAIGFLITDMVLLIVAIPFIALTIGTNLLNTLVGLGGVLAAKGPLVATMLTALQPIIAPVMAFKAAESAALLGKPVGDIFGLHKPKDLLIAKVAGLKAAMMTTMLAKQAVGGIIKAKMVALVTKVIAAKAAMVAKTLGTAAAIGAAVKAKRASILANIKLVKMTIKEKRTQGLLAVATVAGTYAAKLKEKKAVIIAKLKAMSPLSLLAAKKAGASSFDPLRAATMFAAGEPLPMSLAEMTMTYSSMLGQLSSVSEQVGGMAQSSGVLRANMYDQMGVEMDRINMQLAQVEAFAGEDFTEEEQLELDELRMTMGERVQELQSQLIQISDTTEVGSLEDQQDEANRLMGLLEEAETLSDEIEEALGQVPQPAEVEDDSPFAGIMALLPPGAQALFNAGQSMSTSQPNGFLPGLSGLLGMMSPGAAGAPGALTTLPSFSELLNIPAAAAPAPAAIQSDIVTASGQASAEEVPEDIANQAENVFNLFDTDGSGTISHSELRAALHLSQSGLLSESEVDNAINLADKNGDGVVDKQELAQLILSMN